MKRPQWTPRLSTGVLAFLMLLLLGMAGCRTIWEGQGGVEAKRPLADGSRIEEAADRHGHLEQAEITEPAKPPTAVEKKWRRGGPSDGPMPRTRLAEHFALKRVPEGEDAIPVERYAAAAEHARQMPQQSTATGTIWPSRAEMDLPTDAAAALLGTWTSSWSWEYRRAHPWPARLIPSPLHDVCGRRSWWRLEDDERWPGLDGPDGLSGELGRRFPGDGSVEYECHLCRHGRRGLQ